MLRELTFIENTVSGASFSDDRRYRYVLWRRFNNVPDVPLERMAMFVGLNPSTADEMTDDPTIRRCAGFARSWGFDGMIMTNLFAIRSTDPKVMKSCEYPVGKNNEDILVGLRAYAGKVVLCWGNHGAYLGQGNIVTKALKERVRPRDCVCRKLSAFGLTKQRQPVHPLYLPAVTQTIDIS